MRTFREALVAALDEHGTSVRELAKGAGVSVDQLYKVKQGKSSSTNVDDAAKIARYFGQTLDQFMGSPDGEYPHEIALLYSRLPDDLRRKLLGYGEGLLDASDQSQDKS
jgi:transcriptional regulator with XRE-family HTH domain